MDEKTLVILGVHSIFRIVVTILCVNKAAELNRSKTNWGCFGFIFPLLAIIWIQFMKYKIVWPQSKHRIN